MILTHLYTPDSDRAPYVERFGGLITIALAALPSLALLSAVAGYLLNRG